MTYKRLISGVAALCLAVCGGVGARGQRAGTPAEQYLFEMANHERETRGLRPLVWNQELANAARYHAGRMANANDISHQFAGEPELGARAAAAGAKFSAVAENVAEAPTVMWMHDGWMKSPGHRANLLDPNLDAVGISVVRRGNQLYAAQDFSRRVAVMSFEEQENRVASLVARGVEHVTTTEDARATCKLETGFVGQRPWFVMRYTASDLGTLPEVLVTKMATGKYHNAAVGACTAKETGHFTSYNISVMLYP